MNCCYNRPYDDFKSISVYLEAEAKLIIKDIIIMNPINFIQFIEDKYEN